MSRSREIGSQQLKPMKLYETKTIENALFLVFCCLIPVNKTMKPVTQISAIGILVMKKRISKIFVLKLIMQFKGYINEKTERFLIGIKE